MCCITLDVYEGEVLLFKKITAESQFAEGDPKDAPVLMNG